MILADVGNRHIHIYEDGRVVHLDAEDAIESFGERIVHYIAVSEEVRKTIVKETYWREISSKIELLGEYDGMGVDRKALCLSRGDGIYIDAGSALTVDKVEEGIYQGGFLLPGLHAYRGAFARISPALDLEPDWSRKEGEPPKGTSEQISYGIIAPIVRQIEEIRNGLPLYITGGDGRIVASWFEGAIFDEALVFDGMIKALESN